MPKMDISAILRSVLSSKKTVPTRKPYYPLSQKEESIDYRPSLEYQRSSLSDVEQLDDVVQLDETRRRYPLQKFKTPLLLLLFAGLCSAFTLMISSASIYLTGRASTWDIQPAPCGSTPEEAVARGCHFDLMQFSWLPDRCFDAELTQEFLDMEEWTWFADYEATLPLTKEQVLRGTYDSVWVTFGQHVAHCTMIWQKMHRALNGKGKMAIDGYMGALTHTVHCQDMLLNYRNDSVSDVDTEVFRKFPACGIA